MVTLDFATIGPAVDERFPDIHLPDQTGRLIDLHAARAGRGALVVFHRSARWWPFCKTQLVELQKVHAALAEQGVALFAISYDSVETLAAFAEKHGITYPLLSDTGSRVIRELGLLNEHVFEQHAAYNVAPRDEHYGVPYPGVFVLDEAGVIVDKRFQQSYRERETGGGLLEDALGIATPMHGAEAQASAEAVQVRAYLDSPTYGWFQRLRLTVEVTIEPGFHVYGQPVPEGFIPLAVEIESIEGLQIGEALWPAPHRFVLEGLDEEFWVYEGTVRGSVPLTFTAQPGAGDQVIRATVSFQACTETYCLEPVKLRFELPIEEIALVDRPIKARQ